MCLSITRKEFGREIAFAYDVGMLKGVSAATAVSVIDAVVSM
jgi:hypothetical protein